MKIGELCNRDVTIAVKETSAVELAAIMRENHVGDVVITNEQGGVHKPVGIITDRDLVIEVLAKEVPLEACTASDIMSDDLAVIDEQQGIWETLQLMRDKGIRRLPVVNASGGLIGIISADDFTAFFAEQMQELVNLMNREQKREQRRRP